ncbi:Replication protein O [Paraburkholderia guartelaensis]|uniref:Replication protein O n=1 Tax=Paraburkholderia guartelaensis TaxID=2546446 RepID=A0A4R5L463_9BURK|nr:Replication protein O [Paraburkholderia guartelaensis]TDG02511.1 Replication protein O [Paraburkholderia guartelaensis]
MSIAQQFVAGEGEAHPQIGNRNETDSAALVAFKCDSTNLPWVIFRAAFRAAHIEGLPQRARALLSALARTVDAERPFAAIFARRELLTGRAMQSMRTLYRSLDDLEVAGLIDRRAQARYVEAGLFGRAYLHLTQLAAELLGLIEERPRITLPASPVPDTDTSKLPSATVADGPIYKDLYPASSQKRQSGELPADLRRLQVLGFSKFLIFKLMRIARENGKRLSDVVEVTWNHLRAAKRPINYLGSLLRSPVDFGHQLRRKHEAAIEAEKRIEETKQTELLAKAHAGETFESIDGTIRYTVDTDGNHLTVYSTEDGVPRLAVNWKRDFARALTTGRIRRLVQSPSHVPASLPGKLPVTGDVRSHIAGLRKVLGMREPRLTA